MTRPTTHHRADLGRYYAGLPIHAAPGVHEFAAELCIAETTPSSRILEVGAGSGALARRIEEHGRSVLATDLEPSQSWIKEVDLDDSSTIERLGRFDVVLCIETIEHVENPREVLRKCYSLLVDNGVLILSTPHINSYHSRLRNLLLGAPVWFSSEQYYSTGHISPLPDWLLKEHLRVAGFSDVWMRAAGESGFATTARRRFGQLETAILKAVSKRNTITEDDGPCLFVVARR